MNKILTIDSIAIKQNLGTQQSVFEKIADIALKNNFTKNKELVVQGLRSREQQGTTGFMDGFAIPHTKSTAVEKPGIVIITLSEGVEWESMDDQPIRFVISLLIPDSEGGTTHLTLLSSISRMLMHSEVREKLSNASNREEILEELIQAL